MEESDLNRRIKDSINDAGGHGEKLPDPPQSSATSAAKRPYDGYGILNGFFLTWESKFDHDKYCSFNYANRLEPHQWEHLLLDAKNGAHAWVFYGVWVPRKFLDVFTFDVTLLDRLRQEGKPSFWAKELLAFKERGLYLNIMRKPSEGPVLFPEFLPVHITEENYA